MDLGIFNFFRSFLGIYGVVDFVGLLFAEYVPYFMLLAFLIFVLRQKTLKNKLTVLIAVALTAILSREIFTETIRFFYDRSRPFIELRFDPLFVEMSRSFPSGHAAFFFALSAVLFYFNKRWGYWFFAFSLLNGIARIFAGVHWPSDILGGIAVGVISFLIVQKLLAPLLVGDKISPSKEITEARVI